MSRGLAALTLAGVVGTGLVGGVFFAFSTFVMDGIRRLPPAQAITAMQSINRTAPTPPFMLAMFGTAAVCAALIAAGIVNAQDDEAAWLIAGGALYLLGVVALTGAYHVPRNNAVDRVDPHAPDAAERWSGYAGPWTAANHVRTASALAAAAALTVALRVG